MASAAAAESAYIQCQEDEATRNYNNGSGGNGGSSGSGTGGSSNGGYGGGSYWCGWQETLYLNDEGAIVTEDTWVCRNT